MSKCKCVMRSDGAVVVVEAAWDCVVAVEAAVVANYCHPRPALFDFQQPRTLNRPGRP